jgi:hypothetical protein
VLAAGQCGYAVFGECATHMCLLSVSYAWCHCLLLQQASLRSRVHVLLSYSTLAKARGTYVPSYTSCAILQPIWVHIAHCSSSALLHIQITYCTALYICHMHTTAAKPHHCTTTAQCTCVEYMCAYCTETTGT